MALRSDGTVVAWGDSNSGKTNVPPGLTNVFAIAAGNSYAMALTAVTFRVYYIILYLYDVPLTMNYEVSLWISVAGNLVIAEYLIYRKSKAYLTTFTT